MAERNPSDDRAAFGVFPQLQRNRSRQDREAAKNVPIDLARGALAGVLGAPGDIESLVRMLPYLDEKTVLPTSEDIEKRLPLRSETPVSKAATGLGILGGGFYTGPGSPLRVAGAIPAAVRHGAQEFAKASVAGAPHVVKPKGGNWLNRSVEDELDYLLSKGVILNREIPFGPEYDVAIRNRIEDLKQQASQPNYKGNAGRIAEQLEQHAGVSAKNEAALNKWVQSNLTNYVKKEMATPEDPVRKLAEEGISHFPVAEDPRYWARHGELAREQYGGTQMAKSDLAKQWENRSDPSIRIDQAKRYQELGDLYPEWIKKLDPETSIYQAQGVGGRMNPADLGFDHIMDVLRQDVAAGRIRPDQLNKVSMEQAVRRTYEYDQEMARKMREAAIKQTEGFPVHKEYPEGYKWIELTKPKITVDTPLPEGFRWLEPKGGYERLEGPSLLDPQRTRTYLGETKEDALKVAEERSMLGSEQQKMLEDALKYEGDTMGHCVGGYCPDVLEGRTRIFSLRDTKGEPHVTIEVQPQNEKGYYNSLNPTERAELMNKAIEYRRQTVPDWDEMKNPVERADMLRDYLQAQNIEIPSRIVQIKGKQNARPIEKYDPYTQDFVKSGSWSEVGDLKNTGLQKFGSEYLTNLEAESKYKPMVADALNYLETHPSLERHRAARLARNNFKGDVTSPEYRDLERQAGESIAKDVPYTYAELKALLSSPEDWVDRGETIYTPISTAIQQIEKAKKSLGPLPPAPEMKRGGKVSISKNPDTMMLELGNKRMKEGGSEDDTKPYFGGAGTKKYAAAKKRAEEADVNLLKDPKTYAAVASFMGEAPDELGFSVLHPDYEGVRKVADPAYGLGIAAQVAPIVGPLTKGMPVGASIKNVSPLESSGVFTKAMAKADSERALPLVLPRAMPKSLAEINAHAERVARQMMGEHVTSGKAGDTTNLAGRSMKESQRVKNLDYEIVPTKDVPESQVYQPQIGDINVALPGDFTLSDVELKSLQGEPVGSRQQGGSRYGLGHLDAKIPLFYASNEVPAQGVQNKVDDLYNLFGPERVMGHHMAMGPVATNFAQHFADANLRYTDYSKLRPQDMYQFDKIISEGFVKSKKDKKTGETIRTIVDFPDWPGIADPQAALAAMESNPEMRKWYNRVMQTPKITSALNLPSGLDVRYAITSPDLRDMEVNLTGHGVGRMKPGATLTDTANHNTYAKGIQGIYEGHQEVLTPFPISFADATQHIITHYSPKDFTGTIQKVFPHQRVDQQYIDELGAYRKRIKELTGKKKGGAVKKPIKKAAGGAITGDDLIVEERPL